MNLMIEPGFNGEISKLESTARALGWYVYKNWESGNNCARPHAIYGSNFFCKSRVYNPYKLISNPLNWIASLPKEYLGRDVQYLPVEEARKISGKKFISFEISKGFDGIFDGGMNIPPIWGGHVVVSDVMNFTSKYKCFIKNRKLVSSCCYFYHDRKMQDAKKEPEINLSSRYNNNSDDVISFISSFLKDKRVNCVNATVIDVGRYNKDAYAIIKSTPPYMSKIYGCEMVGVLDSLSACIERNQ